jgi:hypothetical protein
MTRACIGAVRSQMHVARFEFGNGRCRVAETKPKSLACEWNVAPTIFMAVSLNDRGIVHSCFVAKLFSVFGPRENVRLNGFWGLFLPACSND